MEKELILASRKIKYQLRKSKRARRVRITIACDGSLTLTMPHLGSELLAQKFIESKINWIIKKLEYFNSGKFKAGQLPRIKRSRSDYKKNKIRALTLAIERLEYYNRFYNLNYQKISVRNQKTRWGSCSRKGNLSFNYKIIYLPGDLADYIIVHELCHLGEFNHGRKFWDLVEKTIPDHKKLRKEVKKL